MVDENRRLGEALAKAKNDNLSLVKYSSFCLDFKVFDKGEAYLLLFLFVSCKKTKILKRDSKNFRKTLKTLVIYL